MHRVAGIERALIVQPGHYGTDHRLLLETLATSQNYRGTAVLDDNVTESEMQKLHEGGVRSARFVFWKRMNQAPSPATFRRAIARMAEFGWHVKIHAVGEEWTELAELLNEVRIPAVIDHFANVDLAAGMDQPGVSFMERAIQKPNWWVLLANGDRRSSQDEGWVDVVPLARRLIEAAPDRMLWATDWPHLGYTKRMPNDGELVELLYRFAPKLELRRKILVDNPARLIGFSDD
jgi:predicted TIM-barrel fold metal-dependent hydrolase